MRFTRPGARTTKAGPGPPERSSKNPEESDGPEEPEEPEEAAGSDGSTLECWTNPMSPGYAVTRPN